MFPCNYYQEVDTKFSGYLGKEEPSDLRLFLKYGSWREGGECKENQEGLVEKLVFDLS